MREVYQKFLKRTVMSGEKTDILKQKDIFGFFVPLGKRRLIQVPFTSHKNISVIIIHHTSKVGTKLPTSKKQAFLKKIVTL